MLLVRIEVLQVDTFCSCMMEGALSSA